MVVIMNLISSRNVSLDYCTEKASKDVTVTSNYDESTLKAEMAGKLWQEPFGCIICVWNTATQQSSLMSWQDHHSDERENLYKRTQCVWQANETGKFDCRLDCRIFNSSLQRNLALGRTLHTWNWSNWKTETARTSLERDNWMCIGNISTHRIYHAWS